MVAQLTSQSLQEFLADILALDQLFAGPLQTQSLLLETLTQRQRMSL
jgi:hypothetical protein